MLFGEGIEELKLKKEAKKAKKSLKKIKKHIDIIL